MRKFYSIAAETVASVGTNILSGTTMGSRRSGGKRSGGKRS